MINTIKLENITHYHFDNVDLLITTHDIPKQTLNILPKHLTTIKVAPLFSEDDRQQNQTRCEAKAKSGSSTSSYGHCQFPCRKY